MVPPQEDGSQEDAILEALFDKLDTIIQGQKRMAADVSRLMERQSALEEGQEAMEKGQLGMQGGISELKASMSTLVSMAMIQDLNPTICSKCKDARCRPQEGEKDVEKEEEEEGPEVVFDFETPPEPGTRRRGAQRMLKKAGCSNGQRHTSSTAERSTRPTASDPVVNPTRRMPCFRNLPEIAFSDKTFSEVGDGGSPEQPRRRQEEGDGLHDQPSDSDRNDDGAAFEYHRLPRDLVQLVMPGPQRPSAPSTGRPQILQADAHPVLLPTIPDALAAMPGMPGSSSDAAVEQHSKEPRGEGAGEAQGAAPEMLPQRPRRVSRTRFISDPLPDFARADKSDMLYLNKDMLDLLQERAQHEDS